MRSPKRLRKLSINSGIIYPLCLLLGALTACQHQGDTPAQDDDHGPNYESFDLSAEQCEARMRRKMLAREITFQISEPFRQALEDANLTLPPAKPVHFAIGETKQIHSVSIEHRQKDLRELTRLIYRLSVGDRAEHPLAITIEQRRTSDKQELSLSQKFWLNETCEPRLFETISKTLRQTGETHWDYREVTNRPDGARFVRENQFDTQAALLNLDLEDNLDNPLAELSPPATSALFLPDLGLANAHYHASEPMHFRKFDLNLDFSGGHFVLDRLGRPIGSHYLGRDPVHHVILTENRHRRIYHVPREIFDRVKLGSALDANEFVTMRLGEGFLAQFDKVWLITAHEPSYDHLAAYWQVRDRVRDPATGLIKLRLAGNSQGLIKATATADDLRGNATIETDHPTVRRIAGDIRAEAPNNRRAQLSLILNYLTEHYAFDYRGSQQNVVRPLSTSDALDRGIGVCQHYAVLFTSVARALGIPTRIVSGYHLHDTFADDYAWVEAEIQAGQFRVIDPTGPTLNDTEPRYYFPIERARELEDKDAPAQLESMLSPQDYSLTFERGE